LVIRRAREIGAALLPVGAVVDKLLAADRKAEANCDGAVSP
jgi:hypothetical protein